MIFSHSYHYLQLGSLGIYDAKIIDKEIKTIKMFSAYNSSRNMLLTGLDHSPVSSIPLLLSTNSSIPPSLTCTRVGAIITIAICTQLISLNIIFPSDNITIESGIIQKKIACNVMKRT